MNKRNSWLRVALVAATVTILCNGCAVVSSYRTNMQAPEEKGVSYYLPRKDVIVTLTIGDDKTATTFSFSVATTEAYPDTEHRFLARYHQSWIGADTLKVGVNTKGLLASTTSADFQSQLPTIMANIAKAAALLTAAKPIETTEECKCTAKGSYSELFKLDKKAKRHNSATGTLEDAYDSATDTWNYTSLCGYSVKIEHLSVAKPKGKGLEGISECSGAEYCSGYTGFFYRQLEPYLVTINEDSKCKLPIQQAVVFSPTNAPLELLPIERGLFANANISFEFEDGSLKSYQQIKASEISAITALPADIASAYFSAIGNMFSLRTTAVTNQANYDKAIAGLLLQQEKTKACTAAIAAKDQAAIDANCK